MALTTALDFPSKLIAAKLTDKKFALGIQCICVQFMQQTKQSFPELSVGAAAKADCNAHERLTVKDLLLFRQKITRAANCDTLK